ncbi:MAG TPA: hypothetical protein VJN18_21510 [Polyangiaceae bacterium]|nr:hypothetical protein [Polyangiaceae bacterium]
MLLGENRESRVPSDERGDVAEFWCELGLGEAGSAVLAPAAERR